MAATNSPPLRPIQGLLLAAGRGGRFGNTPASNKLLHLLEDGTPLALAAARNLKAAIGDVLAVVSGREPQLAALLEQAGLRVSICPSADQGMGASLAWGVAQTPAADGWLVALADMPWIRPETICAVARAVTQPRTIAAPVHAGRRGHPVAFGPAYREALLALAGDRGARSVIEAHTENLILLPSDDSGVLRDVDYTWQVRDSSATGTTD